MLSIRDVALQRQSRAYGCVAARSRRQTQKKARSCQAIREPLTYSSAVARTFSLLSPDKAGKLIPRSRCTQGWLLRQEFQLGADKPVPAPIEPEPIIRGINAKGYYIWREGKR